MARKRGLRQKKVLASLKSDNTIQLFIQWRNKIRNHALTIFKFSKLPYLHDKLMSFVEACLYQWLASKLGAWLSEYHVLLREDSPEWVFLGFVSCRFFSWNNCGNNLCFELQLNDAILKVFVVLRMELQLERFPILFVYIWRNLWSILSLFERKN